MNLNLSEAVLVTFLINGTVTKLAALIVKMMIIFDPQFNLSATVLRYFYYKIIEYLLKINCIMYIKLTTETTSF